MKWRILITVLVCLTLFTLSTLIRYPALAFESVSCNLAAWAGWHSVGLNGWCLIDIVVSLIMEGNLSPEDYY